MMGGSGLIGFVDSYGLKRKATQDYESSSGSLRGPPDTRDTRYRHADGRYFGLGFE